jgi:hypothetical protein
MYWVHSPFVRGCRGVQFSDEALFRKELCADGEMADTLE